jgi:hypothetical protein
MHILIGLAVATVLLIGWICGNVFACVFLTVGALFVAIVFSAAPAVGTIRLMCLACIFVIWVPFFIRSANRS